MPIDFTVPPEVATLAARTAEFVRAEVLPADMADQAQVGAPRASAG